MSDPKVEQDKRISVVIGINDFLVGGAQKLIIDHLKRGNHNKFIYTLVVLREFPQRQDLFHLIPEAVRVYRLGFNNFYDLAAWFDLLRLLCRLRPQIVVSHLFFSNTVFRVLQLLVGYRTVIVEHNTYVNKTKSQQLIDRLMSYWTSAIVAVSTTVARFTSKQENIPLEKFTVIHNGVDVEKIESQIQNWTRLDLRQRHRLKSDSLVFISVGRLTRQKNQELLIRSFAAWKERPSGAQLYFLGEGALQKKLEALVLELNLADQVKFLGVRRDVFEWYCLADALVSTSDIEGLSIAYLESQVCGLPIIATKTAGTDEILVDGENGVMIESSDVAAAVSSFNRYLAYDKSKLKQEAGELGRKFDSKNTIKAYEALMIRLADKLE